MKKDYKKPNTTIFDVNVTAMMATSPGGDTGSVGGGDKPQTGTDDDLPNAARDQFDDLW